MICEKCSMPWKVLSILLSVSIVFITMLWYVFETGYQMSEKYAPLMDASMKIKLEATNAHLWVEEMIIEGVGEANSIYDIVVKHINTSKWYARAMLEGGENQEGVFIPLEDPAMRVKIQNVLDELNLFEKVAHERYRELVSDSKNVELDFQLDAIFQSVITYSDDVKTNLQSLIKDDLRKFKLLKIIILSITIFSISGLFLTMIRYEKQRMDRTSELIRLSNTDGLTKVANKRYFEMTLNQEFHRALRDQTPLSILMIDIDYFKLYNDAYGHIAGDECLKKVANIIQSLINRPADLFARYGGEEFIILLPNTTDIKHLAEHILISVRELEIPHKSSSTSDILTISIGGYHTVPTNQMQASDIIHQADMALYKAKQNGRNQVVLAS